MRRSLGTAVFSGMIGVTLFGIFLTPVFFYVVMRVTRRSAAPPEPVAGTPPGETEPASTPEQARDETITVLSPVGPLSEFTTEYV